MQHSPCGLRCPRRAHMLVKAHGRRWPTAGRFGLFGVRSHCEQTRSAPYGPRGVFWGVERDDLEMILFTLHPLERDASSISSNKDILSALWVRDYSCIAKQINSIPESTHYSTHARARAKTETSAKSPSRNVDMNRSAHMYNIFRCCARENVCSYCRLHAMMYASMRIQNH